MKKYWPAELAAQALRREDVTAMFGLLGGHINPIQDFAYRAGIEIFQVRHEQAAVHAADGYARITGRPGVAFATAGPGMTNTVTAMHMAYGAHSPVVLLLGGHKLREEGRDTAQEADAQSVLASVTKSFRRVTMPEQADLFIKQAFREAMTYPYGPVAVEFPVDTFNFEPIAAADQLGYVTRGAPVGRPPRSAGDAEGIAEAFRILSEAERPVVIGGDGVHWDGAAEELQAFVERFAVPTNLRRHARGAIPESHPLAVPSAVRKSVLADADAVMLLGLHLNYFEGFGDWKSDARFIQVSRHPSDVGVNLATDVEITGDVRSVLGQLNALAAGLPARGSTPWSTEVGARTAAWREQRDAETEKYRAPERRIHPTVFSEELCAALPEGMPVVLDSFTASGYVVQHIDPVQTGQVMDAGLSAAFGHGVGMAIGASVGRGYTPVVSVLGDGGVGLGGGDIETAVRYGVPAVFIVYNNSALCGGLEKYAYGEDYAVLGPNARGGFDVTRDMPYEKMWELIGCHAELVTAPGELPAALERALASGRTAVINVLSDRDATPGLYETHHARDMFWHLPADEVQAPARSRHHEQLYERFHDGRKLADDLLGGEG
ncbi:thiamine pyrophosphate-binding protein [Cytobacillus oceanisediminis]